MTEDRPYKPTRNGGQYLREKDGSLNRLEHTADHPDGHAARDARGRPIPAIAEPDDAPARAAREAAKKQAAAKRPPAAPAAQPGTQTGAKE